VQFAVTGSYEVSGVSFGSFKVVPVAGMHQVSVGRDGGGAGLNRAFLLGRDAAHSQGMYHVWSVDTEIVNLPAPLSNPYIATVILRATDPQYGTIVGAVGGRIDVISGTPASSPVAVSDAAIQALTGAYGGWTRLADIRINTGDTGAIPVGQITDTRIPVQDRAGDPISCLSTARPPIVTHRLIHERDTGAIGISHAGEWLMFDTRWQAYPAGAQQLSAISSIGNGVMRSRYKRNGKSIDIEGFFFRGSTTVVLAGGFAWQLPPGIIMPTDANAISGTGNMQFAGHIQTASTTGGGVARSGVPQRAFGNQTALYGFTTISGGGGEYGALMTDTVIGGSTTGVGTGSSVTFHAVGVEIA
jgi:hypothetical protein